MSFELPHARLLQSGTQGPLPQRWLQPPQEQTPLQEGVLVTRAPLWVQVRRRHRERSPAGDHRRLSCLVGLL